MASIIRTSKLYIFLFLLATAWQVYAQQPPAQQPTPQPGQTSPPPPTTPPVSIPPTTTASSDTQAPPPPPPPPPQSPYDSSDSQFSLLLYYWRTSIYPELRTGHANLNTYPSNFNIPGNSTQTPGAQLSVPLGRYNTIRVDYFRTRDTGSTTLNSYQTLFGTNYAPGNFLTTAYLLQNVDITLDYLTWPWPPRDHKFLFKTRYGIQYTNISSGISGPYLPIEDAQGNQIITNANGSHRLIYPLLGVGIEYFLSKHFRVEMNASGFAFPKRAVTWNGDGFFAYRLGHVEIVAGGKALHFKTSPKSTEDFFGDTVRRLRRPALLRTLKQVD